MFSQTIPAHTPVEQRSTLSSRAPNRVSPLELAATKNVSATPFESALSQFIGFKSFIICTYVKKVGGTPPSRRPGDTQFGPEDPRVAIAVPGL